MARTEFADLYETNDVRTITTDGEVVEYVEYGQNDMTAWEYFTQTAMDLEPGYTIQLIVDEAIAEEYTTGENN